MAKLTKALCSFWFIAAFCFICIGYASFSHTLAVRGTVEAQPPVYDTLVITNVTTVETTTMNSEIHSRIIPTNVESTISGTKGQSVVYRVTVHNYSETETYIYNGILYDDSFTPTLNKIDIKVSLDESGKQPLPTVHSTSYANGTPVAPGEEFVFFVTYTLKENVTSERILINYVFDPIKYTVTYLKDNEVWAIDYVVNNAKEYYVRSEGPSASESDGRIFVDWINANAAAVDKYPVGNTNSYTLSAKWDKLYLIMFVDKDGNVLYEEVFSDSSTALSASGQATVNGILAEMNAEAAKEEMSVAAYYLGRGKYWEYHNGNLSNLDNYFKCCKEINKKPDKVNNFMREYIETRKEWEIRKIEIDMAKIAENYAKHSKAWEFEYGKYKIVVPKTPEDIILEGRNMSHCVGGYVNNVLNNDTYIVFVRPIDNPERCYITCQVHTSGRIGQYFLSHDRYISSDEDKEFYNAYAEHLRKVWNE
jgi:hypothetical protein